MISTRLTPRLYSLLLLISESATIFLKLHRQLRLWQASLLVRPGSGDHLRCRAGFDILFADILPGKVLCESSLSISTAFARRRKNWRSNQKNSGFLPEERAWLDAFLELGFHDTFRHLVGPEAVHYSWWSNRGRARENNVGWRLDYHFATPALNQAAHTPIIHCQQIFSDHAPVVIDYDL